MNTLIRLKPRPMTSASLSLTGLSDAKLYRIESPAGIRMTRVFISRAAIHALAGRFEALSRKLKIAEQNLREQDDWREKYLAQEANYRRQFDEGPDDRPLSPTTSHLNRFPEKMTRARRACQGGAPSLGKRSR